MPKKQEVGVAHCLLSIAHQCSFQSNQAIAMIVNLIWANPWPDKCAHGTHIASLGHSTVLNYRTVI
jgi:hypothetical protein